MKKSRERSQSIQVRCDGGDGGRVTGSCHGFSGSDWNLMVDCGLHQGHEQRSKEGILRNLEPARNFAKGVDQVVITHTHIDHTGRLPYLFAQGFSPPIIATETTAYFMEPMLYNSAEIQQGEHPPLYDSYDVTKTLRHVKAAQPSVRIPVGSKHSQTTVELDTNGHIIGSASVIIRAEREGKTILCTGDTGKPTQSLCGGYKDYRFPTDPIHTILVDSTSVSKPTPLSFEESRFNLIQEINNTWARGGTPCFPVLSLHRAQELLETMHNNRYGQVLKGCHYYFDAPLAYKLLDHFKQLDQTQLTFRYGENPNYYQNLYDSHRRFDLDNFTVVESHQDSLNYSRVLANSQDKSIIFAGGGMCQHGRVVNYLQGDFGRNENNTFILTCHQVDGTPGAAMVRAQKSKDIKTKKARVVKVEGFSSHASGADEYFGFLHRFNLGCLENVIINHGSEAARAELANEFRKRGYKDVNIFLPRQGDVISV